MTKTNQDLNSKLVKKLKKLAEMYIRNTKNINSLEHQEQYIRQSLYKLQDSFVIGPSDYVANNFDKVIFSIWNEFNFLLRHTLPAGSSHLVSMSDRSDPRSYEGYILSRGIGLKVYRERSSIISWKFDRFPGKVPTIDESKHQLDWSGTWLNFDNLFYDRVANQDLVNKTWIAIVKFIKLVQEAFKVVQAEEKRSRDFRLSDILNACHGITTGDTGFEEYRVVLGAPDKKILKALEENAKMEKSLNKPLSMLKDYYEVVKKISVPYRTLEVLSDRGD